VHRIFCILELVIDVCCLRELVIDNAAVGELAEDDGVGAECDLTPFRRHKQHRAREGCAIGVSLGADPDGELVQQSLDLLWVLELVERAVVV
jgi:hypothetical protein